MSDVSRGPGWWMASDGKWYPPESHPTFQPPPPPPPPTPPPSPPSPFSAPPSPFSAPPGPGPYPVGSAPYPYAASPPSLSPPLADYGQRLAGWLIDWVILLVVSVPISIITHSYHYSHLATSTTNNTNFRVGLPGALLSPLIVIAYGTFMCGSTRGQTLGMMIMGTKAVKLSSGAPIGYGPALGRAAFEMLLAFLLFVPWVIDMLFPLWDRMNQTLHDKVSGTIVLRVERS